MSEKHVSYEVQGKIAVVTLQKAPYNICNRSFYTEIADTFEEISSLEGLSCVILKSAMKVFCAGGEFQEIQSIGGMAPEQAYTGANACTRCMASIYGCRYPVIAAVNGKAIGAGAALAACCDIVIAEEKTVFSVPEVSVGFIGASEFLQLMLPPRLARYYYFTGKPIPAAEVKAVGGILDVVPAQQLMERVMEVAEELCAVSPLALRYAKEALNSNDNARLVEKYMHEYEYTLQFSKSEDYKEAIQAMIDHRKPAYTGK